MQRTADESEADGVLQGLLERACRHRPIIVAWGGVSGMLLLASVVLLLFFDLSRPSRIIAVVDVGITGVVFLTSVIILWQCNQRRDER